MDRDEIGAALDASEAALDQSGPVNLSASGFWKAVAAVKREPGLADVFGAQVGEPGLYAQRNERGDALERGAYRNGDAEPGD